MTTPAVLIMIDTLVPAAARVLSARTLVDETARWRRYTHCGIRPQAQRG